MHMWVLLLLLLLLLLSSSVYGYRYIIGPALHVVDKVGSLTHSGMACGGTCIRRSLGSELRRIAKATSESIRVAFLTYSYESTLSTLCDLSRLAAHTLYLLLNNHEISIDKSVVLKKKRRSNIHYSVHRIHTLDFKKSPIF